MTFRPPGTLRVLRTLAWTSAMRLLRSASVQRARRQAASPDSRSSRGASSRRRSGAGLTWMIGLLLPVFVVQALVMSDRAVCNLVAGAHAVAPGDGPLVLSPDLYWDLYLVAEGNSSRQRLASVLDEHGVDEQHRPPRARIERMAAQRGSAGFALAESFAERGASGLRWRSEPAKDVFAASVAVVLLLLTLACLFSAFGARNTALGGRGEWVQWWLMTFPVATRSLVVARALEYCLVQLLPWFTLFPITWAALAALGAGWALPLAAAGTLAVAALVGVVRLWGESWLRLRCSLRTRRNVQGACTLGLLVSMAAVFWVAFSESPPLAFFDFAVEAPAALALLPGAWPVGALGVGGLAVAAGVGVPAAAFVGSVAATTRCLRGGATEAAGVERAAPGAWMRGAGLGVCGKELALLRRDRTFLVQAVVVPMAIIALQLIVNPRLGDARGPGVAIIAYVVGFYGAMGGCFQVLSSEGRALWLLYALPVSVEEVFRQKARLWAIICCCFAGVAAVVFSTRAGADIDALSEQLVFVLFGVWSSAHIAASLSVLGANTTQDAVQRQLKQSYVWLYLLLAGSYSVVLSMPALEHRVAGAAAFATVAYAMWQRAADRMRWLLDPVGEAAPRLTVMDAGAATLVFFVLQLVASRLIWPLAGAALHARTLGFVTAGAVTLCWSLLRLRARGVPVFSELGLRASGRSRVSGVATGLAVGAALGAIGLSYAQLLERLAPGATSVGAPAQFASSLAVAVLAAPVVEELLFRGLLLGGLLRQATPLVAVVWSALLFAFVHPMPWWPLVFVLGVLCAALRLRSGSLWASVSLHAAYNAVVVGLA